MLRFYLAYRALVRAKVLSLRQSQLALGTDRSALLAEFRGYVRLAQRYARRPQPAIVITHGFAGCGKTTLTQGLLELTGAVRVRTDIERKRLHGLSAQARTGAALDSGLYAPEVTKETYRRVLSLAGKIADAGDVAIIDGTFLKRWQRDLFREFAATQGIPFVIVSFAADNATLRRRVEARMRHGADASEADISVLEHQLRTHEPLAADELSLDVAYDAGAPVDHSRHPESWREVIERLATAGPAPEALRLAVDPGLAAKVAFLSQPGSYREPTTRVETIETHMSWVFLTDRDAWKLKKPVRYDYLDFSTEAARHQHCVEEVRLNRRLSSGVYLDVVPLTQDAALRLLLGPGAAVVDWLVRMRRLPGERMLDRMIRKGRVPLDDFRNAIRALCRFYSGCAPIAMTAGEYRERLARSIADNLHHLSAPEFALPVALFGPTCAGLAALLDRETALFDERARAGRILEGHGDLRPEHICLLPEPQIIDCLEFSRDFRILDPADELAFLALECERLGAPGLKRTIFDAYTEFSGDAPPEMLVHFYQSHRACMRAKIALWHLKEPALRDSRIWPAQARDYLRLAREHVERCPRPRVGPAAQEPSNSTTEPPA